MKTFLLPPPARGYGTATQEMLGPADELNVLCVSSTRWGPGRPGLGRWWVLPFIYALGSEGVDSVNVGDVEDGLISRRVSG